jgi:hypothetical protein
MFLLFNLFMHSECVAGSEATYMQNAHPAPDPHTKSGAGFGFVFGMWVLIQSQAQIKCFLLRIKIQNFEYDQLYFRSSFITGIVI